jgi:hypothetical protein
VSVKGRFCRERGVRDAFVGERCSCGGETGLFIADSTKPGHRLGNGQLLGT